MRFLYLARRRIFDVTLCRGPACGASPFGRAVHHRLVQQASGLGQFAGPASLGLWVEHFGWQAAPAILALLGLACAFAFRRMIPAAAEQRGRCE